MDFMPLRLNSSSLTCSICGLAAIILRLVAMECRKLHLVGSPIPEDSLQSPTEQDGISSPYKFLVPCLSVLVRFTNR